MTLKALLLAFGKQEGIRFGVCRRLAESPVGETETVVSWHRAGFGLSARWRSRQAGERPKVSEEIRILIRRMAGENAGWGAPNVHGELRKLGFEVSKRPVARYQNR